ncbi:putative PEP-binding protein [Primorskyibacter sp. S187A]|uniref:putative PEP-binding protein n=1 Tax=Primorskyibacter sp. S187A TaxID=3415130 RepID=UPI003C79B27B
MLTNNPHITPITADAPMKADTHGGRAKCLQRLVRMDLPVPATVALSFDAVHRIANGELPDIEKIVAQFPENALLCVRPSSQDPDWGGPGAILNIGMNDARFIEYSEALGRDASAALYTRFVEAYAVHVARLDPDMFDDITSDGANALSEALRAYEDEAEEAFPQDPAVQLSEVLRSMARAWEGTSARLLRQAKGAPADAGLGLVVQQMALGLGSSETETGSGVLQLVDPETGMPQITGRYLSQSQGRDALGEGAEALYLTQDDRGPSLEDTVPDVYAEIIAHARAMRRKLREEMQVEFTLQDGRVHILDGVRVPRSNRAALRIAVALAEDGIISKQEAVMRIEPRALSELLHRQIDPDAYRDVIGSGIAASPGAASGRIVFSAAAAQASASRGEPAILVRRETSPEDIRGMQVAAGVLTERGGMTSHAAVIGRGMGLPCVVGAARMSFNLRKKVIVSEDGRRYGEGDMITLDGAAGQVLDGAPPMREAALDEAFTKFMSWADAERDIAVRANADTLADAALAQRFKAEGIGLCRTEHMFFENERLTVMREMIFADSVQDRRAALDRLLPMQRQDFTELFRMMAGAPLTIRLFDPPLHEFLPHDKTGMRQLAEALDLPVSDVERRVESLAEYNPMLGLRGVRVGITVPEIYEMQARAIFEATLAVSTEQAPVVPEIMIPLVSARREVELVRMGLDAVAAAVRAEQGRDFTYHVGVMVETPRAALRAREIAAQCDFLSFGTNDLTQMTYGLSRDDAGRFMSDYVQRGVFEEDPFHVLDAEGVGELLEIGVARAREAKPQVLLSICGEHGGNPESIHICRELGFSYISCSPFRVPVARLAAAQCAIADKM